MRQRRLIFACLAAIALQITQAHATEPANILLDQLLGLDQQMSADGTGGPLAEMEARGETYAALREQAKSDTSSDLRGVKLFLFAGWVAAQRGDFATSGGFKADLKALYDARPDQVLAALADNPFMIGDSCSTLGSSFFYEDADPDGFDPFIRANEAKFVERLGGEAATTCLEAMKRARP